MKKIQLYIVTLAACLLCSAGLWAEEIPFAGITPAQATLIEDTVELKVQDGGNYIKFTDRFLPAVLNYLPDTAFGPIPVVIQDGKDTLPATMVFEQCQQQWRWEIPEVEEATIITISSHENARILVEPRICPPDWDSTAVEFDSFEWRGATYTESEDIVLTFEEANGCVYTHTLYLTIHHTTEHKDTQIACDELEWQGKKYTESGLYRIDTTYLDNGDRQINFLNLTINYSSTGEDTRTECVSYTAPWGTKYTESGDFTGTITNVAGCDSVISLHLTVIPDCTTYDTLYFCPGMGTERDERVSDNYVKRYRPYNFESPKTWDYMEGVILQQEQTRTLMNLRLAEQNLMEHYVGGLQPIDQISWTIMYVGAEEYVPLAVSDGPQWIDAGMLALQVRFICGVVYNEQYPTDITNIDANRLPTKRIENGQVVILRNGEKYSILGSKIE